MKRLRGDTREEESDVRETLQRSGVEWGDNWSGGGVKGRDTPSTVYTGRGVSVLHL